MRYRERIIEMNIVYLQCDCRYNKWILENTGGGGIKSSIIRLKDVKK